MVNMHTSASKIGALKNVERPTDVNGLLRMTNSLKHFTDNYCTIIYSLYLLTRKQIHLDLGEKAFETLPTILTNDSKLS